MYLRWLEVAGYDSLMDVRETSSRGVTLPENITPPHEEILQ